MRPRGSPKIKCHEFVRGRTVHREMCTHTSDGDVKKHPVILMWISFTLKSPFVLKRDGKHNAMKTHKGLPEAGSCVGAILCIMSEAGC